VESGDLRLCWVSRCQVPDGRRTRIMSEAQNVLIGGFETKESLRRTKPVCG